MDKVNLNLWISLTEEEYAILMNKFQDEYALKFALSLEIGRFIKSQMQSYQAKHINPKVSEEIA